MHFDNVVDKDSINQLVALQHTSFVEPLVQPGDILSINIQTIDYRNISIINDVNASATSGGPGGSAVALALSNSLANMNTGFSVDTLGYVKLPIMGKVMVAGLTIPEVRLLLYDKAKDLYKDPIVTVHFANFKISILGEVNKSGTYNINLEKFSIIDALNLAGDIAVTGDRTDILLMREGPRDQKFFVRLNLNDPNIFKSPYYYLAPNDVLYIEATKVKIKSSTIDYTQDRYISYFISSVSLIIALYSIFK
jgi:polysaccharide export outer membrane protein